MSTVTQTHAAPVARTSRLTSGGRFAVILSAVLAFVGLIVGAFVAPAQTAAARQDHLAESYFTALTSSGHVSAFASAWPTIGTVAWVVAGIATLVAVTAAATLREKVTA